MNFPDLQEFGLELFHSKIPAAILYSLDYLFAIILF